MAYLVVNNAFNNFNSVWVMDGTNYAGFANLPSTLSGWQITGMA